MRTTTVRDVMTHEVVSVGPRTPFKDIIELIDVAGISAVPVTSPHGMLLGVVSEADLLRRQEHQDDEDGARAPRFAGRGTRDQRRTAAGLTAGEIMTSPVLTVASEASLPSAARLLARAGIRRLFVVEDGQLVGVVARRDLLHTFLRADGDIQAEVERDVLGLILHANRNMVRSSVRHGVVMLTGRLEYEADVHTAVRAIRLIPGVVEVTNRLDYVWAGEGARPGELTDSTP